mmetsp:Transcript_4600/g.10054  ORF Transcript_4600/g.10054 Transcript_4600/m.10054 type:complete len:151 (+) Transcript_4600:2-454(+)
MKLVAQTPTQSTCVHGLRYASHSSLTVDCLPQPALLHLSYSREAVLPVHPHQGRHFGATTPQPAGLGIIAPGGRAHAPPGGLNCGGIPPTPPIFACQGIPGLAAAAPCFAIAACEGFATASGEILSLAVSSPASMRLCRSLRCSSVSFKK